ncbi:MAG: MBL fold metallo-hydrolase [Clostridia bacterium]|nr:MBL fold metallo-hydrolase [Clostridia bacterium]
MTVHNLYYGSWLSNCYAIISRGEDGINHAAIIDPSSPADKICEFLDSQGARLDMIFLTHGHFDHIMSLDDLRERTGAPIYVHTEDAELLGDSHKNAYSLFFSGRLEAHNADGLLHDGDILTLGNEKLKVIHLPGHTEGSIGLLGDGFILTGDTLFDRGVGRSDLYGGDEMKLYASIGRLKELEPSLKIYPGHGKSTTLGRALEAVL